jgi:hypothetical protein
MLRINPFLVPVLAVLVALAGGTAFAQQKGKIVCWKDKSGKTVGCGDKVPPEYEGSSTRELSKSGVTRKTNESAEEEAKRVAKEKEAEKDKSEQAKKLAEQKRQDMALVNTYSSEKEIDLRRDRDLATIDAQVTQLRVMHKNASVRQGEVKGRMDQTTKSGKPATDHQKEDLARADADVRKFEHNIVEKEKEKDDIRKRYTAMKERYMELTANKVGASAPAPTAAVKK